MIRFAHPLWLHLLWAIAPLVLLCWWDYRRRLAVMRRWAAEELWDAVLYTRAPGRLLVRRLLTVGALASLIFATAGPRVGTRLEEVKRTGTDIVIAIDVSSSMLAEDITPNRLSRARLELEHLLSRLKGDRVALVPFAGTAFVQVPLTLDYAAVMSVMAALEPGLIPQPGTALGAAIQQARRAFRTGGKAQKVMLIISDGEDHEAEAVAAAKQASEEGIIIYAVGMATPNGAPIPMRDGAGRITDYKRDRAGETVVSRLNDELLREIAAETGGTFYRATSTGDEFRQIQRELGRLQTEDFESKQFTDFEDRFQWPAGAAALLLLLSEMVRPSRRRKV